MFVQANPASASVWSSRADRRLRAMVDDHWVALGRILRSLGVPEPEVEDGLQQVYLVAAAKLDAIERGKERAFLVQVAVRIAARVRRHRARSRETLGEESALVMSPSGAPSAEEHVDRERALTALMHVLDSMDDDTREVFVLHEVEELTMADIAAALGLPPGTVASRLRRAREQFEHAVLQHRRTVGALRARAEGRAR